MAKIAVLRQCDLCGCTEALACPGGCTWRQTNPRHICSSCFDRAAILSVALEHEHVFVGAGAIMTWAEGFRREVIRWVSAPWAETRPAPLKKFLR